MTPPQIYIVMRRTTDWGDEDVFRAQLSSSLRPIVDLWNDTFDMPFHLFRHRIKAIALLSHARVEGAAMASLAEVPRGALLVPTDDDDWFSPDLARVLTENRGDDCRGMRWPTTLLEVPFSFRHRLSLLRRRLLPRTPPKWICTSNNYALSQAEGIDELVRSHMEASWWLEANPAALKFVAPRISVQNRHLASITSLTLGGPLSRAGLEKKYRRYVSLYTRPPREAPDWCAPYVAQMASLMSELRLRRG